MKTKPVRITYRLLQQLGACRDERDRFRRVFPRNADLTPANVKIALHHSLPIRWLTTKGMTERQYVGYNQAIANLAAKAHAGQITWDEHADLYAELIVKYIKRRLAR